MMTRTRISRTASLLTTRKAIFGLGWCHASCRSRIGISACLLFLAAVCSLLGATLPSGFTETQVGSDLSGSPTAMEFAPDGRLFVCLQDGRLRVIKDGTLLATPF